MLLINKIKIAIKGFIKIIYFNFYNIKHKTNIKSSNASVKARYGLFVAVGDNTIVNDDVEIGDYSYINKNSSIENCSIGKFCSISSGVYICPAEHNLDFVTTHPIAGINRERSRVVIGNDVLISLNAIILEGVNIGNGAVIAAGAVVTRDVKPYEIVGGIPAKHIRYRFSEDKIVYFQKIKWWDWDSKDIECNLGFLRNESRVVER